MRLAPVPLLACAATFCQGAPPQTAGAVPVGNGASPPTVVRRIGAAISDEAQRARLEGTVVLAVAVREDGSPGEIRVVRSIGMGLDEKAIEAVKSPRWKFMPGIKNGVPVPATATVEVSVGLSDPGWNLTRAEFDTPAGAYRPVLIRAPYPSLSRLDEKHGTVTVSLDVSREGSVEHLRVEKSSNPALEDEAMKIARDWKFRPATQDGKPISVRCTLDFVVRNP